MDFSCSRDLLLDIAYILFKGAQGKRGADGATGRKGGSVRIYHCLLVLYFVMFMMVKDCQSTQD